MPKVKADTKPEGSAAASVVPATTAQAEPAAAVSAKPPAAKKASGKKAPVAKAPKASKAPKPPTKSATQVAAIPKASPVKAPAKKAAKPKSLIPVAPPVAVAEPAKAKQKLVRDSFTMPSADFGLIHALKERALNFKRPAKKSELLRAGLHALSALTDAKLKTALDSLAPLKAGRPKKGD